MEYPAGGDLDHHHHGSQHHHPSRISFPQHICAVEVVGMLPGGKVRRVHGEKYMLMIPHRHVSRSEEVLFSTRPNFLLRNHRPNEDGYRMALPDGLPDRKEFASSKRSTF